LGGSEKVQMLGRTYLLIKPTIAAVRNVMDRVCQILPPGSVVVVESSNEAGKTNVRCGDQELWIFSVDLFERGDLLLAIAPRKMRHAH